MEQPCPGSTWLPSPAAQPRWQLPTTRQRAKKPLDIFDRGLIDAASALQHLTGEPVLERLSTAHRHNRSVFLTRDGPRSTRPTLSAAIASKRP